MNIILWILFGALAGWIASLILNRDSEQGLLRQRSSVGCKSPLKFF
jgi:uncharacterized membrane protein YeaQ/YmgE (transglycosylase-associated protein family)